MKTWSRNAGWMLWMLAAGPALGVTTWYVDIDNCPGPGDGTQGNPFCSVQAAIDVAVDGDTVLVAPGRYVENLNYNGKDIALRSTDGPETTILDGDFWDCVVKFRSGEAREALLEGFTLTNGIGFNNGSLRVGGAIATLNSSPTIRNNHIIGNTASYGGGIDIENGNPLVDHNIIAGNYAEDTHLTLHISGDGGGVSIFRSAATLLGNQIYDNRAFRDGGGIWSDLATGDAMTIILRDNLVYHNSAEGQEGGGAGRGGGAFLDSNHIIEISGCTFTRNQAVEVVDGITLVGGSNMNTTISNSILHGNGQFAGDGRELYISGGTVTIAYSDVRGGQAGVTWVGGTLNWGAGNVDVDPVFRDLESDDYHLDECSPLADAGDPAFVPEPGRTDIDGDDRVLLTAVDMGADEVRRECGASCTGNEHIGGAKCRLREGVNRMTVKLLDSVPGDTFTVTLSSGESKSGTIKDTGRGKAKFRGLPSGPGTATAVWGCGAVDTKDYECP